MKINNFDNLFTKAVSLFSLLLLGPSPLTNLVKIYPAETMTIPEHLNTQSVQDIFGQLIINKGEILVNRIPAMTGQAILRTTAFQSGEYADAIIDLGPKGLIVIRENTNFELILADSFIMIKSGCKSTMIEVRFGEATVLPYKETLGAHNSKTFDKPIELRILEQTHLSVDCSGKRDSISKYYQEKSGVRLLTFVGNVLSTVVKDFGATLLTTPVSGNISSFRP